MCVITVAMVMLLRDFGPYGIIFMNMCVITVAMVMLLRDFGPYGIIFMNMCVITVAMGMLLREFGSLGYVCYNRCHDNAVKGFWALWDNIYDRVFTYLNFHSSFIFIFHS
jgi:uncharacterized YccA/Bax inhibitor family protein